MNRQWLAACFAALVLCACGDSNESTGLDPVPPPGGGIGDPGPQPQPDPQPDPEPDPQPQPDPAAEAPTPTARGTAVGAPVSAVIGPAGGELTSAEGSLTVQVPAGAFVADQTVSIQAITNEAHGGQGRAFRILPEGIETTVPMTVHFQYTDSDLRGTVPEQLMITTQDADGVWHAYSKPTIDTAQRTLAIKIKHFSDWAMMAGAQISPYTAAIRPGEELALQVIYCRRKIYEGPLGDDLVPIPDPVVSCEADPVSSFGASAWSVNGVQGGGGQFGSVVADPDRWKGKAQYTAPPAKPAQNKVSVSARHRFPDGEAGETLLVSNITIVDGNTDCSLSDVENLHVHLSFDDFKFTATYPNYVHSGHHSGQLMGNVKRVTPPIVSPAVWISYLEPLERGYVFMNDTTTYTPPPGREGYTETHIGEGPPNESMSGRSFISLITHAETCTYDIIGSFFVEGTYARNGAHQNGPIGVGGLYVHGQEMQLDQVAAGFIDGTKGLELIEHNPDYDRSGYAPLDTIGSGARNFAGSTVARWQISVIE
jgi:hypothetical protein